jgi:hypothetical protein
MPDRKSGKKGSFDGDLDELVRVFKPTPATERDGREDGPSPEDKATVHDRLFERAWRAAPETGDQA